MGPRNVSAALSGVLGLGDCGDVGCTVRSIWERRDLPNAHEVSAVLSPHDSAFFVVSSTSGPPQPPTPTPMPSPAPTPVGPCVQPNILFDSHKDGNTLLDGRSRTVADSTACQELCYETDGCVCFS